MINTLTLDTEHQRVYVINDGNCNAYRIDTAGGVLIGLVGGQVTATDAPVSGENTDPRSTAGQSATLGEQKRQQIFNLASTAQLTIGFNPGSQSIGIIGAVDIVSTIPSADPSVEDTPPSGTCQTVLFDLTRMLVHLQRRGDKLVVTEYKIGRMA